MHDIALLIFAILAQDSFVEVLESEEEDMNGVQEPSESAEVADVSKGLGSTEYHASVAEKVVEDQGSNIAEELMQAGYARDAARQVTSELAADIATCILNAVTLQAAEKSLDVDWYLGFFAHGTGDPDVGEKLEALDIEATARKWQPCINEARVARGLEPRDLPKHDAKPDLQGKSK